MPKQVQKTAISCEKCNERINEKWLKRHIETCPGLKCSQCDKEYSNLASIRFHIYTSHKKEKEGLNAEVAETPPKKRGRPAAALKCGICQVLFPTKHMLSKHATVCAFQNQPEKDEMEETENEMGKTDSQKARSKEACDEEGPRQFQQLTAENIVVDKIEEEYVPDFGGNYAENNLQISDEQVFDNVIIEEHQESTNIGEQEQETELQALFQNQDFPAQPVLFSTVVIPGTGNFVLVPEVKYRDMSSAIENLKSVVQENSRKIVSLNNNHAKGHNSMSNTVAKLDANIAKLVRAANIEGNAKVDPELFPINSNEELLRVEQILSEGSEIDKKRVIDSVVASPPNLKCKLRVWKQLFDDAFNFDYTLKGYKDKKSYVKTAEKLFDLIQETWEMIFSSEVVEGKPRRVHVHDLIVKAIEDAKKRWRVVQKQSVAQ